MPRTTRRRRRRASYYHLLLLLLFLLFFLTSFSIAAFFDLLHSDPPCVLNHAYRSLVSVMDHKDSTGGTTPSNISSPAGILYCNDDRRSSDQPFNNHSTMRTIVIDGRVYNLEPAPQTISPQSTSSSSSQSSPPVTGTLLRQQQQQVDYRAKSSPATLSVHVVSKRSSSGTKPMHTCSVCGDRAFYVFYGALACDSCRSVSMPSYVSINCFLHLTRTFFRRQVLQCKVRDDYCRMMSF